ncbi:MAG: GTP cyclohydrolase I FolE [Actinomycetota bacterium]|nr:GTP cyclohydrolase I FolE [Actinomycetota bacterium]
MAERASGKIDRSRIEWAVREILLAIGEDPQREGLTETPGRVAEAYAHLFSGLHEDPARQLDVSFAEEARDTVLMRDIPLVSFCEHHLLPMIGKAHVGYSPNERVVGFSEIVRLTEGYARRPQLQERLTAQIADALYEDLGSRGSFVVVEATQLCMVAGGAKGPATVAVTSAARGVYEANPALRADVLNLVSRGESQR